MKKLNLLPYFFVVLLFAFSSCNSEVDVMEIKAKPTTQSDEDSNSETAFGKKGDAKHCFDEDGFQRWGWTNGPFTKDSFVFPNPDSNLGNIRLDLYAGAGQCEYEDKGEYVGYVSLYYNVAKKYAYVVYNMPFDWVLDETHFYIGSNKYPVKRNGKETVAPGQYPYKHSDLGGVIRDVFENVDLPEDEFYIIAHAVVSRE
jgi:hypothetical protein